MLLLRVPNLMETETHLKDFVSLYRLSRPALAPGKMRFQFTPPVASQYSEVTTVSSSLLRYSQRVHR